MPTSIRSRVKQFAPTMSMEREKTRKTDAHTRTNTHSFSSLLKQIIQTFLLWLTPRFDRVLYPNEYELKKFHVITTSTHMDGVSIPETGVRTVHILYDLEVVHTTSTTYIGGVARPSEVKGNATLPKLVSVARAYLRIMRLSEHQAGGRALDNPTPVVPMTPLERRVLVKHRDFLRLRQYWLDRGYDLRLYDPTSRDVKVFLERVGDPRGTVSSRVRSRARVEFE